VKGHVAFSRRFRLFRVVSLNESLNIVGRAQQRTRMDAGFIDHPGLPAVVVAVDVVDGAAG
jgi:hypothetical protein